jgi:hypothetical protein
MRVERERKRDRERDIIGEEEKERDRQRKREKEREREEAGVYVNLIVCGETYDLEVRHVFGIPRKLGPTQADKDLFKGVTG